MIQLLSSVIILVLVVNAIRSLKKSGEEIWQAGLKAMGTIDSDGEHAKSGIAVSHKAENQGDIKLRCPKCKVFAFIQENQSSYYICYNCKSHVTAH